MRLSLVFGLLATNLSLTGCALPYYWQAAAGQLDLLRRREPIAEIVADSTRNAATRRALERVIAMRAFAISELGLPDNDSYTTYADIGRRYVVWNVVAADEFSVDARQWCFPIAGCVTYRGYFEEPAAARYARSLREAGFDTYVAGVTAYSTLGYFSDPILSTMLSGGDQYVAGVIFHELAHQRFYLRGDTELNEAFATAVAEYGTEQWLLQQRDLNAVDGYRARVRRQDGFFDLISRQQARLREIYAREMPPDEMRAAKRNAFERLRSEYGELKLAWGGADDYDPWFEKPLNNAQLASVVAYSRWLPGLRTFIHEHGLEALYAEMDSLSELGPDARKARLASYSAAARSSESG